MRTVSILATFCLLGLAGFARAAGVALQAQVSDDHVSVGQQFVYSAQANSDGGTSDVAAPILPNFGELSVVQNLGASQSSQIQIINGAQSASMTVANRVVLVANKEGTFTIPPATLNAGGQTIQSNPVTITVAKPQALNLPSSLAKANILPAQTNSQSLTQQLDGRLFMMATVDNTAPYEGEPVHVTYTVYTDIQPETGAVDSWLRPETAGLPDGDFDYISVFNMAVPQGHPVPQPQAELKQIDGRTFRAIKVFECYCIPRRAGALQIGPYRMLADVPVKGSNDPFGLPSIFDDNSAAAALPTTPVDIQVRPLPVQGRPAGAHDVLIGDYQAKAELDRSKMSQDELATYRLTVEGRGNAGSIVDPGLKSLGPFDIFNSSKKDLLTSTAPDGLHGGRVFEYVLRAKQAGALTIPPVAFTVFNPATQQYQQVVSNALSVQVTPSANAPEVYAAPSSNPAASMGSGVKEVAQGLNYIETTGFDGQYHSRLDDDSMIWALQAVPLLLMGGALGWRRRRDYLARNQAGVRKHRAGAAAAKHLRKASASCRAGQADGFYAELASALRGFFSDKFGRPAAGLRIDEIQEELANRGIDAVLVSDAVALIERSDSARFAPGAADETKMRETLARAQGLIETLDRKL